MCLLYAAASHASAEAFIFCCRLKNMKFQLKIAFGSSEYYEYIILSFWCVCEKSSTDACWQCCSARRFCNNSSNNNTNKKREANAKTCWAPLIFDCVYEIFFGKKERRRARGWKNAEKMTPENLHATKFKYFVWVCLSACRFSLQKMCEWRYTTKVANTPTQQITSIDTHTIWGWNGKRRRRRNRRAENLVDDDVYFNKTR